MVVVVSLTYPFYFKQGSNNYLRLFNMNVGYHIGIDGKRGEWRLRRQRNGN